MVELRVLGKLELTLAADGNRIRSVLSQPKRAALLTYLVLASRRGLMQRSTVLGVFWPDRTEDRARHSLSQALHVLRRGLGQGAVMTEGKTRVGIDVEHVWCDALRFQDLIEAGQLQEALDLYRGDFLDGFYLEGHREFEEWVDHRRGHLSRLAIQAALSLSEQAESEGQALSAVRWARRASDLDPHSEAAHRRLLSALVGSGDRTEAQRAHRAFTERVAADLDIDPSAKTEAWVTSLIRSTDGGWPETDRSDSLHAVTKSDADPSPHHPTRAETAVPPTRAAARARRFLAWAPWAVAAALGWIALSRSGPPATTTPLVVADGIETLRAKSEPIRLAVLELENLGDEADRYLARGLTQELRARLVEVSRLNVLGVGLVMPAKDENSLRAIQREWGADALLEGTIRRDEETLRVVISLVEVETGQHIWSRTFDRPTREAAQLPRHAARETARSLAALVSDAGEPTTKQSTHPAAYEAYLRGIGLYNAARGSGAQDLLVQAVRTLQRSVELDGLSPPARFELGRAHMTMARRARRSGAFSTAYTRVDSALAHLNRGLELGPGLPEGTYLRAFMGIDQLPVDRASLVVHQPTVDYVPLFDAAVITLVNHRTRISEGVGAVLGATRRYPPTLLGLGYWKAYYALTHLGLFSEADRLSAHLNEITGSGRVGGNGVWRYLASGDWDAAERASASLLRDAPPGGPAYARRIAGDVAFFQGDYEEAKDHYETYVSSDPTHPLLTDRYNHTWGQIAETNLAFILHRQGLQEAALAALESPLRDSLVAAGTQSHTVWYDAAAADLIRGDREAALDNLATAVDLGWHNYYAEVRSPLLGALRGHPRYESLMDKVRTELEREVREFRAWLEENPEHWPQEPAPKQASVSGS